MHRFLVVATVLCGVTLLSLQVFVSLQPAPVEAAPPPGNWVMCPDGIHAGHSAPATGTTCTEVCASFGRTCIERSGQAGLNACSPSSPPPSGTCSDVFSSSTSSQCHCGAPIPPPTVTITDPPAGSWQTGNFQVQFDAQNVSTCEVWVDNGNTGSFALKNTVNSCTSGSAGIQVGASDWCTQEGQNTCAVRIVGSTAASGPGSWTVRAPMPTARWDAASAVVNGKIYVFGGGSTIGTLPLTTNEMYDPATNTWTTKAPMPTGRSAAAAAAVNGKIYVIGGFTGSGSQTTHVNEMYDPATNTWTTKAPRPRFATRAGIAVINGKIYVVGGEHGGTGEDPVLSPTMMYMILQQTHGAAKHNSRTQTEKLLFTQPKPTASYMFPGLRLA